MSVQPLAPEDLAVALPHVLASAESGRLAGAAATAGFLRHLRHAGLRWQGWSSGPTDLRRAVVLMLYLPGDTVFVLMSPVEVGPDPAALRAVLTVAQDAAWRRKPLYLQTLQEPGARRTAEIVASCGFAPLARLDYLERGVLFPWVDPPPSHIAWNSYRPELREDFAQALLATYIETLDCPALTGVRPTESILATHQAAGVFDPGLWELANVASENAGIILLAGHPHDRSLEVVYMGVAPAWRRAGVGGWLLQRALEHARRKRARRLTLVVDAENEPAQRLYRRYGFRAFAQREAWWQRPARAV